MSNVTVYIWQDSSHSKFTIQGLEHYGVPYRKVYLRNNPQALDYVARELGHWCSPVVVVGQDADMHWHGFRPELIERLATIYGEQRAN